MYLLGELKVEVPFGFECSNLAQLEEELLSATTASPRTSRCVVPSKSTKVTGGIDPTRSSGRPPPQT